MPSKCHTIGYMATHATILGRTVDGTFIIRQCNFAFTYKRCCFTVFDLYQFYVVFSMHLYSRLRPGPHYRFYFPFRNRKTKVDRQCNVWPHPLPSWHNFWGIFSHNSALYCSSGSFPEMYDQINNWVPPLPPSTGRIPDTVSTNWTLSDGVGTHPIDKGNSHTQLSI